MRKAADYQGWSNWETWNTSLMADNEYEVYKKLRDLFEKGMTVEQLQDFLLRKVIGPYNKERIEDAKEWNSIPEDERIDHHYEELKEKSPGAADLVDALGMGKDVSDVDPELIDPELVNWQEIWDHLADEVQENDDYDREKQRHRDMGLSWTTPGHDDATQKMRDAFYRYHGAIPEEELDAMEGSQWDNPRAYHNINVTTPWEQLGPEVMEGSLLNHIDRETRMKIWERQNELYPNMSHYEREHVIDWEKDPVVQQLIENDPNVQRLKQEGYTQRLHDLTWQTMQAIWRQKQTPYADTMRQALEQRGYSPEEIAEMMQPRWRWQPNPQYRDPNAPYDQRTNPGDWINLSPKMDQAQVDKSLDQPGDMTLPEHWGNVSDPWDAMFADQGNDWSDPDATQHRRPFIIDFEDIDNPDPPIWIGEPGQYHDESPLYNVERPYYGEIWEHTDPPVIQRSWGTDDVYDSIAKAQAERYYYQQQGMKKRAKIAMPVNKTIYHVAPTKVRESIQQHGIDSVRYFTGDKRWTDEPGFYAFGDPEDARWYAENFAHQHPVEDFDIWRVTPTILDQDKDYGLWPGEDHEDVSAVYHPEPVGPENVALHTTYRPGMGWRGPDNVRAFKWSSDGADYWTQSQDDWWGTQNDSLFNVNTPGEAPGMPHSQNPNTLVNPCWCDVDDTPHEWTGACENGKRPTMEHEAAGEHWRDEPRDESGKWTRHPDSLKPVKGKHHRLKVHDHKNHEHHIVRCFHCGAPMDVYKGEESTCHNCGERRGFEDEMLDSLKDSSRTASDPHRLLRKSGFKPFAATNHADVFQWEDPDSQLLHRISVSRNNPAREKYVREDLSRCQGGTCHCDTALWQPSMRSVNVTPEGAPIRSNDQVEWGERPGEQWVVGEIAGELADIINQATGEVETVPVRDLALAKTAGRSVILYHGTTNKGWQVAQENGGIGARDYEQAAAEVAEHYGLDPQEVYEHDWNQFTRTRTANDVWLTGSRQAAEHYAQDRNEVTTDLLRTVFRMTQMTEESPYPSYRDPAFTQFRTDYFQATDLRPVVLTLEVPLDALPMTAQRQLDAGYTDLQDTTLKGPVPLEWVTKIEELPDNPEAPFQPWYSSVVPSGQVHVMTDEPDDEWGEGQWDTDTFLDHRMLNKSLREQQQAQEYLDFMKRHKRAEDSTWPEIGMKEAADSPNYSDDPEAWMADREAWYAQEPRDCPRCGRGPTVYGSDLHGEKMEWCPSCGWTDREEVKQQQQPKPGDLAYSRDGHPVQIIRLYTQDENLFALVRYLDGYMPYPSVGGRAGGSEEDPLWEHRVYDGKVVKPGGDYYNPNDWKIEKGLRLADQDQLPGLFTSKTAADNVPGMPVSDSGHWVWLDGKVGFGGAHHEIAEKLADELGYGKDDKAYVSNWLARGHCPQDRAVAVGTFKNNRPYIWNSTRDRNHIWDAVMQAREATQTAT